MEKELAQKPNLPFWLEGSNEDELLQHTECR